jgi:hypothetical protein
MTALWEAAMKKIATGDMPLGASLDGVLRQLRELISRGRARGPLAVPGARSCPVSGCKGFLRKRTGIKGPFWSCTRYPGCRHTSPESQPASGERGPQKASATPGPPLRLASRLPLRSSPPSARDSSPSANDLPSLLRRRVLGSTEEPLNPSGRSNNVVAEVAEVVGFAALE